MNIWLIVALFLLALAAAFFTWQAAETGEMWMNHRTLSRAESPSTFHIALVLRAGLGVLCLAAGVWGIFGGTPHG
jgi:hypothetical protein